MTTEYLTGYSNERYRELLSPVKTLRIDDMEVLQEELRLAARLLQVSTPEHSEVHKRYAAVTEAINWWKEEI